VVAAEGAATVAAGDLPGALEPAARKLELGAAGGVTVPDGEVVTGRLKVRKLDSDEEGDEDKHVEERRHGGRRVRVQSYKKQIRF